MAARQPFALRDQLIKPGSRAVVELPIAAMPHSAAPLAMEVMVIHGRRPGPTVWASAAIHGDEVNGVAIVRELASQLTAKALSGTLLLVPVVNVFGFIAHSRYLPDGRDLNRSFPGSPRGSLAARVAYMFFNEVVSRCSVGIDLHTATRDRANLPQVRADLDDPETARLATAFGAPVTISAPTRPGSLRGRAAREGIPVLVYESGQAHRFNESGIETGVRGIQAVLTALGMLAGPADAAGTTQRINSSRWVRAGRSGILAARKRLGDRVEPGDLLAIISDPFGRRPLKMRAPMEQPSGVIIGRAETPLVLRGDAIYHVGYLATPQPPIED